MSSHKSILAEIIGKEISCICRDNVEFFKFNEICKGNFTKLFPNYKLERSLRFIECSRKCLYVDFQWAVEMLFRQPERKDNILKLLFRLVEINMSSNDIQHISSCGPVMSQTNEQSEQTTQIPPSESQTTDQHSLDLNDQNIQPTESQNNDSSNKQKRKRTTTSKSTSVSVIDKENLKKALNLKIPERNILQEKEVKKKRKKTKQFKPNDQTIRKKERRQQVIKVINEKLGGFRKIDEKKYTKVNLAKINLVSDDSERTPLVIHNSVKRSDLDNSFEQSKTKCEDFMEIFAGIANLCNIELSHIFLSYFRKNVTHAMSILNALLACKRHPVADEKTYNELQRMNLSKKTPSLEKQLKTKDEVGLSDYSFKEIVLLSEGNMKASLTEETKKYNKIVQEYFNVNQVKNGFKANLLPLMTAISKAHLHQVSVRKEHNLPVNDVVHHTESIKEGVCLPEDLKWKISMDGREFGNLRTVVVTLQVLNLLTFATQDPKSVIPICMFVGEESEVMDHMKDFEKELQEIANQGLCIEYEKNDASLGFPKLNESGIKNSVTIPCEFYWVSDLKSLSYVSILRDDCQFCAFCDCERENSVMSLEHGDVCSHRDIGHKFGIKNIYFCILHLDERITEYIMKMTLISTKCESQILGNLKKIHGFGSFSFSVKEREEQALNISEYSFMFTGSHCSKIFGHIDSILDFVKKDHPKIWKIWEGWRTIRRWIYYTNEQLDSKSSDEFFQLKNLISEWGGLIAEIRRSAGTVGDYIHIVVNHLFELLTTIGSLVPFSNQAVEHSHKYDRWLMERCVSRGKMNIGTKKTSKPHEYVIEDSSTLIDHVRNDTLLDFTYSNLIQKTNETSWNDLYQIAQIMFKKFRILYLSFTAEDVVFKRLELRVGSVIKSFWERNIEISRPPLQFDSGSYESPIAVCNIGSHSPSSYQSLTNEEARQLAFTFTTSAPSPTFMTQNNSFDSNNSIERNYPENQLLMTETLNLMVAYQNSINSHPPYSDTIINRNEQSDEDDVLLDTSFFKQYNQNAYVDEQYDWQDLLGCADFYFDD